MTIGQVERRSLRSSWPPCFGVANCQGASAVSSALEKVHDWNPRKTMFTLHQIQAAWDRLLRLGWFDGPAHADGHQ